MLFSGYYIQIEVSPKLINEVTFVFILSTAFLLSLSLEGSKIGFSCFFVAKELICRQIGKRP